VFKRDHTHTLVSVPHLFERRVPVAGGEIHNIHHIVVEGRVVAQVDKIQAVGGAITDTGVVYLHQDAQGSTGLVTNAAGKPADAEDSLLREQFYDPFGRRLGPDYKPRNNNGNASIARFGYTGHEHDDEYGLINMKGRIFSPEDRRFLTPDPVIAEPLSSQAHNRYTYVQNNPATFTDPTGLWRSDSAWDGAGGLRWDFRANVSYNPEARARTLKTIWSTLAQGGVVVLRLGGGPSADDDPSTMGDSADASASSLAPADEEVCEAAEDTCELDAASSSASGGDDGRLVITLVSPQSEESFRRLEASLEEGVRSADELVEYDAPTKATFLERIRQYTAGGSARTGFRATLRKLVFRWMIARGTGFRVKDGKLEAVQVDEGIKLEVEENDPDDGSGRKRPGGGGGGSKIRSVAGFLDGLGAVLDIVNTYKEAKANNRGFWEQADHDNARADSVLPGLRVRGHPELSRMYPGDA
jgi:RHS repeat-associated protein